MSSARSTTRWLMWVGLLCAACASAPVSLVRTGDDDPGVRIRGLVACGAASDGELQLDPARPLVLIVPGRGDPGMRYRALSWRFEQQGQQVACFATDDRESLEQSSARLIQALEQLERLLPPSRLVVVGHSLGGLIARRALVQERKDPLRSADGFRYALVTIAAPFGGVRASADCGHTWLHIVTLGVSAMVCSLVAGEAWQEIPPGSAFVRHPGTLLPEVETSIQVVTDERGACRRRAGGACLEPDAVFTIGEQRSEAVERDPRARVLQVTAGHAEIVGEVGIPPAKLLGLLERQGLLDPPLRVAGP
jgi:pimeloyl-ACP methyl ester carboxylesterase